MRFFEGMTKRLLREENERLRRQLTEYERSNRTAHDMVGEYADKLGGAQQTIARQVSSLAVQRDALADLEKQLDRAKALIRFHKQVAGVYRRRWEASARPGMGPRNPEAKAEAEGEAKVAAAIDARTVPGDAEGARHLRSYADRRVAEMRADGKGEVDYGVIATEILDGEDDDE